MTLGEAGRPPATLSVGVPSFAAQDPGDWSHLFERVGILEAGGIDRVLVSDHVVFGEQLDAYGRPEVGGRAGGKQPTGPDGHWLEPIATLAVLAGRTTRIRLGTNILIAALRRPVVLAKQAATIDVLSGGRLDLGVGVGWQREEYEAAGLDFEDRGRLLDHTLEVCRELWSVPVARYESPELQFERIHMMPKPLQAGGVPIWVSGTVNPRVVRRLAAFGSGWIPWGDAADDVVAGVARMRSALADAGRDPTGLAVAGDLPVTKGADGAVAVEPTMDAVPALLDGGVTDFRIRYQLPADRADAIELTRALTTAFRSAVGRTD